MAARTFAPVLRRQMALASKSQQIRAVATQSLTPEQNLDLLASQRKLRPSSPHFTIYEPQLTWLSSIANRVTGTGLSVGFYAFACSYLAAPAFGVGFDSADLIAYYSSLPQWFKYSAKMILAAPFWFHTFNGLRHLCWDMGYLLELKTAYTAGYIVIGLTGVATLGSLFL